MKSHRSGLMGLALGAVLLGAAACDDQTEVVIPPPPPDPITVNVTPEQVELAVGQTLQFVATVTGGEEGADKTVTWSSSASGFASVNPTTGVVTAVAPGNATITATSNADPDAKDAGLVTVVPDPSTAPVALTLRSLTIFNTNTPVNVNNVFGQIDATIEMDVPQGAVVTRVELVLDGNVVASQAFAGNALADASAADELNTLFTVVLSLNTAAFSATNGAVTHPNGPHSIFARVVRPNGTSTATPAQQLIFNNTSFMNISYSAPTTTTSVGSPTHSGFQGLGPIGSLWHTGNVTATILSVNYGPTSGPADADVASVTLNLTNFGLGVSGVGGCTSGSNSLTNPTIAVNNGGGGPTVDPDGVGPLVADPSLPGCGASTSTRTVNSAGANPFTTAFSAGSSMNSGGLSNVEDIFSTSVSSVTEGGQAGPVCINPDPTFNPQGPLCGTFFVNPLRVDNLAPRVTQISIERPPNQYFGPNIFDLSHAVGSTEAVAGTCGAPCARSVDYGTGGQTETGNVEFRAGPPGSHVAVTDGGPELAESGTSDDYIFGIIIKDRGGNSRTAWATDPAVNGTGNVSEVGTSTGDGDNQMFGWDATAPTHTVTAGPANNFVNPDETDPTINPFVIGFSDSATPPAGPSGFLTDPVQVKLEHFAASQGTNPTCRDPDLPGGGSVSCNSFRDDDGMFPTPGSVPVDGYFNYTIFVEDAAANESDPRTVILILEDVTAPAFTGGIVAPASIIGGQPVTTSSALTDNVDLGSLNPYIGFGATVYLGRPLQLIGGDVLNPLTLVGADAGAVTWPAFPRSLENNNGAGLPGGVVTMASEVSYNVRDMAGHVLRYDTQPWPPLVAADDGVCPVAAAPNTATQNCSNREASIAVNVLAPLGGVPVGPQFGVLNTLNGADATHGLWITQAPATATICNNTPRSNCAGGQSFTSVITATVTGPVGTFQSPFTQVQFYFLNGEGRWDLIDVPVSVTITDNTVSMTRTVTYTATWDARTPKVRPAGAGAGTAYTFAAFGWNATGDLLTSQSNTINIRGN